MMILNADFSFSAAHMLPEYDGPCSNQHGHNYELKVSVKGEVDPETHMVMDFKLLDDIVRKHVISKLDHTDLNTVIKEHDPTAERTVEWIWERLEKALKPYAPVLEKITLSETNRFSVTYRGE